MSFRPAELLQRAVVNRPVLTGPFASADDSLMMITVTLAGPVRLVLGRRYRRQVCRRRTAARGGFDATQSRPRQDLLLVQRLSLDRDRLPVSACAGFPGESSVVRLVLQAGCST